MTSCQVCLCEQDECAETGGIKPRYMLPCRCQLHLCDTCVSRIDACLYHRKTTVSPNMLADHPFVLELVEERNLLQGENVFLQRLLRLVALSGCFIVVINTVAYLLGGLQCGIFVSFFSAAAVYVVIQIYELDMSPALQAISIAWCTTVFCVVLLWSFNKIP